MLPRLFSIVGFSSQHPQVLLVNSLHCLMGLFCDGDDPLLCAHPVSQCSFLRFILNLKHGSQGERAYVHAHDHVHACKHGNAGAHVRAPIFFLFRDRVSEIALDSPSLLTNLRVHENDHVNGRDHDRDHDRGDCGHVNGRDRDRDDCVHQSRARGKY